MVAKRSSAPSSSRRTFAQGLGHHPSLRSRVRSEEHTSELQSHLNLVCRLLLEKKKKTSEFKPHSNSGIIASIINNDNATPLFIRKKVDRNSAFNTILMFACATVESIRLVEGDV